MSMQSGLLPEQIPAATNVIGRRIDNALADRELSRKQGVATADEQRQVQEAAARYNSSKNIYKDGIENVMAGADNISDPAQKQLHIAQGIAQLKQENIEIATVGEPPKKFAEIFMESLSGINPLALLGNAVTSRLSGGSFFGTITGTLSGTLINSVKDAAVAYGGDMLAAKMKMFKNNTIDTWLGNPPAGGPMTEERARWELAAANAGAALAKGSKDPEAARDFANDILQEQQQLAGAADSASRPQNLMGASWKMAADGVSKPSVQMDPNFNEPGGTRVAPGQTPGKVATNTRKTVGSAPPAVIS